MDGREQKIDLWLVLDKSAKDKPQTEHAIVVATAMDRTCHVNYLNPDGSVVGVLTVNPAKLEQKSEHNRPIERRGTRPRPRPAEPAS